MPGIGVNLRVTGYCNQGGRKYMEDMFSVAYQQTPDMKDLEYAFFGIFDGHGGSEAAAYAKDHLLDTIIKDDAFWSKNDDDVLRAIRNGYVNTHIEMWKNLEHWPRTPSGLPNTSGTTASIAFIMRGKIYTGHVGDSCIVLGYQDEENGEWKAKPLTRDHKPESFEEKVRIEECGGKVINKSGVPRVVWNRPRIGHKGPVRRSTTIDEIPFLAVARALGDFWSFNSEHNKFVVSPEPDVDVFDVDPSKHRCLIFGTDGLWNVLSADVAISNVYATEKHNIEMKTLEKQDWLNPSKNLVDKAILQWNKVRLRADNTTVITLMLDPPGPPAPQVLLKHKMQTGNIKCEDKSSCKYIDGDPQVQRFGKGSSGGYAIFTRYPTDHIKTSNPLASTSKSYCNTPVETPPIKTNKVLRTSVKLNNYNNNNNNDTSNKKSNQPTGKRSARTSSGKVVKKQKLNESTTTDETVKFRNSDSENEQIPNEPWLLSSNKPIKTEDTKVGVVLRSSGRIPKTWKCNNSKDETTPPKITTISKIKTPLTEPMTRTLRSSHKKKIENVRMLDRYNSKKTSVGTLYLTATHLIFIDTENNKESWVLLMHIGNVEKLPLTTTGCPILIRCKTFLSVTFLIPKERDSHNIFTSLLVLCQPSLIEDLYCFLYKSNSDKISKSAGWDSFDLEKEFKRMNVPNESWSLTTLNKDYQLCDTYPKFLYVPSSASTSILLGSAKFRSKERLPVLTYLHHNKASICRCAQPLSGFNARCMEDEQLLTCILHTNPGSEYMYVVDTRPKINAMANRATGKGYENENFYENIKFNFLGIENIHVMRSSLSKVVDLCEQRNLSMSQFIGGLDSSGWLRHIKTILDTSAFICQAVNSGKSVVVHCSDGWDRTAQVCSLASLMLDPYYRSFQGFQALIEKDWLAFGHKFSDRCGHIAGDSKEVSPVFTQFIEATWQLTMIQPTTFEFNERFLLILHDHVTSCQYGTFIGNSEKERGDLKLKDRTFSFWGYVEEHKKEFLNPLYSAQLETMYPDLSPQNIRFWRGMYCRFENGVHPREHVYDILLATSDQTKSLDDHVKFLQKRLSYFKRKITDGAGIVKNSLFAKETNIEPMSYNKEDNIIQSFNETFDNLTVTEPKLDEAHKVAIEWKSLREAVSCECSTDSSTKKYHCWKCGNVFCTRCIDMNIPLPGHLSQDPVPVCHGCRKIVSRSSTESS